ncbi:MAG TPA: hypothetical protein VHU88_00620 [Sporichthyaceae bacterium]|jgi:hypothetical protein|nr:hypothetical protein [Sporichthyaceae bacterium]
MDTRINPGHAIGLLDKVVGLNKEIIGHVLNREGLIQSGEAQQGKGTEKLRALREQAKAESHLAKARVYENKQRAADKS